MRLRALRDLLLEDRITPAKYADIAGPRFQVESGDLTPAGPNHYTTGDPLLVGFTPSTGSPLAPLFRIDNGGELIAQKDKFGKDDVQIRMVQGIVATVDTAHQTIFRGDYTWLGNTLQGDGESKIVGGGTLPVWGRSSCRTSSSSPTTHALWPTFRAS